MQFICRPCHAIADGRAYRYRHAKSAEMSKAQHEAETMLHEFLSASCPFCGDIMVESVAEPLITAEDEAEALDWEL